MECPKILRGQPVIGIMGKARAGKDTIADYLSSQYGVTRVAFADELKVMASNAFDLSREHTYGDKKEDILPIYNISPRKILQDIGVFYRGLYDDFWVEKLHGVIEAEKIKLRDGISISDTRFPNEVKYIKEILNGIIIKVIRPDQEEIKENQHTSETALNKYEPDFVIINDGTLEELNQKIDIIYKEVCQ